MLQRRALAGAARLMADGQAAAAWQGFARQQPWQQGCAAAAAAATAATRLPLALHGGLRWHSELAERPKDASQQDFEYVAPFGTAVSRVKVRLGARLPVPAAGTPCRPRCG